MSKPKTIRIIVFRKEIEGILKDMKRGLGVGIIEFEAYKNIKRSDYTLIIRTAADIKYLW